MKITIEIDSDSEMDKLSAFFNQFNIDKIRIISDSNIPLIKGDKAINPKELFGI